ncbi:Variable large protein 10 (plasmid) [Borrelia turicatae]|uniref:Variable large protein n=1 Tax=Borrelia turicatae TaxID=142 RepID=A0A172XD46_BORTU|nr:variable large family protein [Borrelia turicatae]ANF34605.1 Variable large protein 10 [Borrelia turicatae]UPA15596.1 variable large family protein [Borrelia turicatae]UPA15793.1 variable large family protein [Borrelia turicatae]
MKHKLSERIKNFNITILISLFLLISCGSGQLQAEKLAAESKISFFDSLIKIGQGFQEIFGIFGNAIGDTLGLTAVKSGDNKSKVGEHFKNVGEGLTATKDKLDGLAKDITAAPHADTTGVETTIKGASDVIAKLIDSVTKLAGVTNDGAPIGDAVTNAAATVGANTDDVNTIIKEVKEIIETAKESGVKIEAGNAGNQIAAGDASAGAAVVGKSNNAQADAGAAAKLAAEVSKADPWAMLDKIKNAVIPSDANTSANNATGALATKLPNGQNQNGATTNADLVAAVALKAMTKNGKFSAQNANEEAGAVKAAAASAVNKVLGVLNVVINKTVASELDKVGKAVKGIQYFETTTEATEASTTQPTVTK